MKTFKDFKELEKAFTNYYELNNENATHVFVYSKTQSERALNIDEGAYVTTFKGQPYSEMRNRDSIYKTFKDEDVIFLGVGTYNDCNK